MPRYTFGGFELDSEARVLWHDGEPTAIAGRALDVLIMLVQNRGRLIDKDELLSQIWAGNAVEESNLAHCIFSLRKVLNDSPKEHRYIATIAGRGYQFVAPVTESTSNSPPKDNGRKKARGFRRWTLVFQLGVAGALFITFVFVRWRLEHAANPLLPEPRLSHFTSYPEAETMPAFSPDGKQIAYVRAEHEPADFMQGQVGRANIYTKLIGAATELRLTDDPGADYYPAWSPDGQYIGFYRDQPGASGIYIVSALGGHERRISNKKVGEGGLRWLRDGRHLLISQFFEVSQHPAPLIELSLDTSEERQITSPPSTAQGDAWPAVSPDGRTLAFLRFMKSEGMRMCFMDLASERMLSCRPLEGTWPEGLAWEGSGSGIILSEMRDGGHRLWRYEKGAPPVALTSGEQEAVWPAVSPQGNQLAYVLSRRNINLWQLDIAASPPLKSEDAKPVAASTRYEIDPAFSPDGRKLAFMSDRSGSQEIWVADFDTNTSTQLTQIGSGMTGSPSWSPDGSQIAFDSEQSVGNIFVIPADGGTPRRITNSRSGENYSPCWSRDGQFVYFTSSRSGKFQIWKAFAATGETPSKPAEQVTKDGGFRASVSADGKYLYYAKRPGEPGLWRRNLETGSDAQEELVLQSLQDSGWWALGPGTIYFFDLPESVHPRVRLKALDIADRSIRDLGQLPYPVIRETRAITVSPDGRRLVYIQIASMEADIMLLENFR
jgi:Tol biopolymer transport system component/DNA-binding winged helix-turn-helix (wHTH) protein